MSNLPLIPETMADVFASKPAIKIAVQAEMYGSSRKINRQMVVGLFGAKAYFDCTKAIIATDGELLPDALKVAKKLDIEVLKIYPPVGTLIRKTKFQPLTFENLWKTYIVPLEGVELGRPNGKTNVILKVDWSGVTRKSSTGKVGLIKIEIFKFVMRQLLDGQFVSRDLINQNYVGRASSGIILILSQIPLFTLTDKPVGLKMDANHKS